MSKSPCCPAHKKMLDFCTIYLIEDEKTCNSLLRKLNVNAEKVLSLDCEWKSGKCGKVWEKCGKVALLQLSTPTSIFLVHLSSIGRVPVNLRRVLGNPTIVKTGVNCSLDASHLQTDYGVKVNNVIDIDKEVFPQKLGLSNLVSIFLDVELPKDKIISCSNWEIWPLTEEQILYAAADAYYSLLLYYTMINKNIY